MADERRRQQIEEVFRRYAPGVGGYVLARVGDPELAEAIVSNVFVTVVRRFEQCRTPEAPAAWLWSIVRTEIARHYRGRRPAAPLDPAAADGRPGPHELAERGEQRHRIRQALGRLAEDERRLVWMKFFLDLPNTEIAATTGLKPSYVGVLIHRAVKRLRGLLAETTRTGAAAGGGSGGAADSPEPGSLSSSWPFAAGPVPEGKTPYGAAGPDTR